VTLPAAARQDRAARSRSRRRSFVRVDIRQRQGVRDARDARAAEATLEH